MRLKSLFTSSLPASQEFTSWLPGWMRRAIVGTGGGKFRPNYSQMFSVMMKEQLMEVTPGELMNIAMEVPHLNTVLSTGAELFSLVEIIHLDKNGEEVENSKVLEFLKQPNPLQTLEQFLYELYILNGVYNKTFQHLVKGAGFQEVPSAMWLLPSGYMKIHQTGKMYRQTKIEEIIQKYEMLIDGNTPEFFEVNNVIYMAEGVGNNKLNPVSRIEALQIPLSNIMASLKSRNIITSQRGAIGIMSPKPGKDSDSMIPMNPKEKEEIRKDYQKQYHLDGTGGHVLFTSTAMDWTPIVFDIKQLGLLEGNEEDFSQIISAFRHDRDIYPSVKGATFENKSQGQKITIQNAFQPLIDKVVRQWMKFLIKPGSGERLEASYAHLPCMQEDKLKEEQSKLTRIQGLSVSLRDGIISHEQYAEQAELKFDGTGESISNAGNINVQTDNLGKIPLAIQQLALARERANTAGDTALSAQLAATMDKLIEQLIIQTENQE